MQGMFGYQRVSLDSEDSAVQCNIQLVDREMIEKRKRTMRYFSKRDIMDMKERTVLQEYLFPSILVCTKKQNNCAVFLAMDTSKPFG